MMFDYLSYLLLVVVVVMFFSAAIRILREYERGIVFTLGRFTGVKGPGLIILIPFVQQMVKVDLRVVVQDVPPQDVITRDNVTVKVNAVLYFRIVDRSERSSRSRTLWPRPASWRKPRCAPSSANTSSTNCWRNGIGSTLTFRGASISRPTPGASR
jgi:regulator of protease activity HflC (stomatin/prohibitin superfamily)